MNAITIQKDAHRRLNAFAGNMRLRKQNSARKNLNDIEIWGNETTSLAPRWTMRISC